MSCFSIKIDGSCSGGGGGSESLQDAYDNSTNPEIVLTPAIGGLTIRDNVAPLGTNLFEVQDNSGTTTYLSVDATGVVVDGKLTVTGIIDPTATVFDEQATCPSSGPGKGTIWVRNDTPTTLMYTDDTGTDVAISTATAPDLQDVYNNGNTAVVNLTAAIGQVELRDNAVPIGNLFTIQNSSGNMEYFGVNPTQTSASSLRLTNVTDQITIQPGGFGYTITAPEPSADRVLTIPDPGTNTDIILGTAAQTISNKELIADNIVLADATDNTKIASFDLSNKMSGTSALLLFTGGDQVITFPDGNVDLVSTNTQQTLENKNLDTDSVKFVNGTDPTKVLRFDVFGLTSGNSSTLSFSGANQNITFPSGSITVADTSSAQTLASKKLVANTTQMIDQTDPTKVVNFDVSGTSPGTSLTLAFNGNNQVVTFPPGSNYDVVGTVNSQVVSGKLLVGNANTSFVDPIDNTKRVQFSIGGKNTATTSQFVFSGGGQNITFPTGSLTVADLATAQTFTNKTLTSPIISTPSISSPVFSGTGSGLSTTLSNGGSTFNWYQTSTFTPRFAIGGSTLGITYVFNGGRYVRIGQLVFVDAYIQLSSKGLALGNVVMIDLPFTVNNTSQAVTTNMATNGISLPGTTTTIFGQFDKNAASMSMVAFQAGASTISNITGNQLTNTSSLNFCGTYFAA